MVGIASGINEVSRDCIRGEIKKPLAFIKTSLHIKWIESVKKSYDKIKEKPGPTKIRGGANTKQLTHLALIAALCILLMI